MVFAQLGIHRRIQRFVILAAGPGLALTVKTYGFRTIRNSSADSADGDLGGSGLAFTVKPYGFRTIRNSSADSADGDLGGLGLAFTVNTDGFRTIRNSSPDSPEGDLEERSGLTLTIKQMVFAQVGIHRGIRRRVIFVFFC